MWKVPHFGSFVALVTVSYLLFSMGPAKTSAFGVASSSECRNSYNLSDELVNKTVDEYHNFTEGPRSRTILAILGKVLNGSSRFEIASALNISTDCLDYLDFTLPEVALFLLNTSQFNEVTFDDAFRGVFVPDIDEVLRLIITARPRISAFGLNGNETLEELALSYNVSLTEIRIVELLLLPFNNTDTNLLAAMLETATAHSFDLLNHTTEELAAILDLRHPDDLKHYTFLQLLKISFAGEIFFRGLQMKIREVRDSLHVTWYEITQEVVNVTNVLDLVLTKVPMRLRYLRGFLIGAKREDLELLNTTLEEFAELVNMTVTEFRDYKVYPQFVLFIVKTKKEITVINGETKVEIRRAVHEILMSYSVNIEELIQAFNLTEFEINELSPLRIEVLCARFTLIRYATNLNMTLSDVAEKLNKTEAALSHNLTVKEFHVVIRKLLIVRTFEVMSHMLGVSQDFLKNSLEIKVPLSSLSLCELDTFLNITRHTVLDLSEVVTQKTLAFVVQINGVSITFVYKLTIEQFITRIMRLDIHYIFTIRGLHYSFDSSRLQILQKYTLFDLERLFYLNGEISEQKFIIFRRPLIWIINKIIYLEENDVDECDRKQDRCHRNSHCSNLPGTYECHCPPRGYRGRYCDDINECQEQLAMCPRNAYCRNTPGSYQCICGVGYRHNATSNTCDDINECDSVFDNFCFFGGFDCINTEGSYYCMCPNGSRYDNRYYICRDINECDEDPHICHRIEKNSDCRNRRPGFECLCKSGFQPFYNDSVTPRVLVNCTDIDECASGQAICPLNSECINFEGGAECRCLPGYQLKNGKCRAKRFISVLLIWIRVITTRTYTRVDCPSGFPYFGKLHKKFYIYHNGIISVGKRYYRAEPKKLKDLKKDVIAVFWANTDVTRYTSITYQVVDRSTPEFREQLDNTTDRLKNCTGIDQFHATWMLVVTWERVSPFARFFFFNPYVHEQSTYQAVLITNGTASYVIFNYEDGGMNWTRRLQRKCAVGYSTKSKEYHYQDDDSFEENIFHIDSKEFVDDDSRVRTRGYFCKSLNTPNVPTLTNEQKCMNWYNEEPDPDFWLAELNDCPASRRAARRDNRYKKVSSKERKKGSKGSKVDCYELKFATRVYGASHECCYFKGGPNRDAFVSEPPEAGRAYRYHYKNKAQRQTGDIEPFEACCSEGGSELCSLFYQKRPLTEAASAIVFALPCWCRFLAGGCRGRSCGLRRGPRRPFRRPFRAWFFGDPHISTLDSFQYTFNGLGEYVLTRSLDNFLHFHGRTERPLNTDGELTNATVFSAFAFKTNDSDRGQIVYDDSVPGNLSITVSFQNSSCRNYTIGDFDEGLDFTGMSIERSDVNNNTVVVSFPSGFSIEVSPGIRLLQLSVSAPDDLMNNTEGLLGTFNGIKTDDLQYPNGTVISSNATEEEIFHLGQEWKVPYEERMFVSSSCMLQNVSFDDTFIPAFLNLSASTPEIQALCGDNRECIFDVQQTGNTELGEQTKGFEEDNQAAVDELGNTPPEIKGPTEINVTLNQEIEFSIEALDADNDTITIEIDDLPAGAMFNFSKLNNMAHFVWRPVNASNVTLEFVATDSKNDSSVLSVVINMCKCENDGECDFTEFVGDNSGAFRVVGCNCSDGYEGTFCETEIPDACADDPCFDNVTCNTTRNPFGFQCGPCPEGLTGDGENCYEFDECASPNVSLCNQTCENSFGSFSCECDQGYISREEGRICEEINECQDVNTRHNCTENAFCTNLPGSFNCTCNLGFEGDPYTDCTDIDECTNGIATCSQNCLNTPGSFECSCKNGFQLDNNMATCEDIDECQGNHDCERICDNRIGTYLCRCPPGFELNADNVTCKVAEGSECDETNGGCSDVCVNRTGEITCYCNSGYNLTDDGKTCIDINECMTGNHGCEHECVNNNGSFTCSCNPGYALAVDGKTCKDFDECDLAFGVDNCSQVCENTEGSFQCSCEEGFLLQQDNESCADIDECQLSPCSDGLCDNIPGSFQCLCPVPTFYSEGKCRGARVFAIVLTLSSLNGKVVEWEPLLLNKTSAVFGLLAREIERQINAFYRSKRGFLRAIVRLFRRGSVIADVDLNFAENATDVTPETLNSELPDSGEMGNLTYDPQSAQIKDFNECDDTETHNCHKDAMCHNTDGSFECKCKDGYQGDGTTTCDPVPKPADEDDDNNKRLAIILGCVFGAIVLLILIVLCCVTRGKRYKADMEEPNVTNRFTSRSVHSDIHFPENEKEKKTRTGSYELNPAPLYGNLDPELRTSGEYDYPDPFPSGTRRTFYDNPGLQPENTPVKASQADSGL